MDTLVREVQKDQVVEKNLVSISQENFIDESQQDKLQHSENQQESFVQQLNDQHTSMSDQGNSQMRRMKPGSVPFTVLIPILRPNLDKDRSKLLEAVYAKLRSNDISKENFLRVIRYIVGDRMLKKAAQKVQQQFAVRNSQSGSSSHQTSHGAQHFVEGQSISHLHSLSSMQPQRGQTSTSVQQLVEVDVRPDMGSAKSNEVDNPSDTQGQHPAQVTSTSMNVVTQERELSSVSVQAVDKQQQHQPSSLLYGGTVNSHVFTRPPGSSSVTSKKPHSQGSQIRQLTPQGLLPPQSGATQPMNMMNASMYEVQSTVTDANKHGGSVSHLTSHLSPVQSQVPWQSSTSKEQKASSLSTMPFVEQEVAEQTVEQQNRPQCAALEGSFGTLQIDQGSPALSSAKDETDEKQLSRTTFSSSTSIMMTPQLESAVQVRSQMPSATLPIAAVSMKTLPKKSSVGQKKPFESQGNPPPASKKQKVSGAYHEQSIEQLNDVTAVSGVNLREEEEQLLSAPKEESRASEATCRVVLEEEERLILLKGPLRKKLVEIMSKCGVKSMNSDVERCLSLCVEARLRGLMSNLIRVSRQTAKCLKRQVIRERKRLPPPNKLKIGCPNLLLGQSQRKTSSQLIAASVMNPAIEGQDVSSSEPPIDASSKEAAIIQEGAVDSTLNPTNEDILVGRADPPTNVDASLDLQEGASQDAEQVERVAIPTYNFPGHGISWSDDPQTPPLIGTESMLEMFVEAVRTAIRDEKISSIDATREVLKKYTIAYHMLGHPPGPWMKAVDRLWNEFRNLRAEAAWKVDCLRIQELKDSISALKCRVNDSRLRAEATREQSKTLETKESAYKSKLLVAQEAIEGLLKSIIVLKEVIEINAQSRQHVSADEAALVETILSFEQEIACKEVEVADLEKRKPHHL